MAIRPPAFDQGVSDLEGTAGRVPSAAPLAGFASLASSGFSKMMTCCQGRNSSDSLKVKPWGSTSQADLLEGHLVLGLDGDLGVLAAELDQDQPAAGLERGLEALQGRLGVGALVVDVDHQDQVDGRLGEAGVGLGAADGLDVGRRRPSRALSRSMRSISGWTSVA